ncbi:MAG: glycosyltransferase [Acidobacteria bacterium]|nr:glycosyltransferase [Acidobacteriota bacterium]
MKVLYIVYWGAAEPLGQSLVLPAVERLSARGASLTLVTFEKAGDVEQGAPIRAVAKRLRASNVRWVMLHYHKRPKVPATAWDWAQGVARSVVAGTGARPDVVHARTFIGGLIGLAAARLTSARLVYHNEGFYPDEQVDSGVWVRDSLAHRLAGYLERRLYRRADAILAMSHSGKDRIERLPGVRERKAPVVVVPSCVDLDRFKLLKTSGDHHEGRVRLVYSGSVGGRYRLDAIGRFVAAARRTGRDVRLSVMTHSNHEIARELLSRGSLASDAWSIETLPHADVPQALASHDAGVHFLNPGLSDGGSPTKIGEYWAVGLPAAVTPRMGDTDAIIQREGVGIVVDGHSDVEYRQAFEQLLVLLRDSGLAQRCRRSAEAHYNLDVACDQQMQIYDRLTSGARRTTACARV